jgi:DNA-binding transcriptional ArsR family regulator
MTQTCNTDRPNPQPDTAECCRRLDELMAPEFFKALGDSRRLTILMLLATGGSSWTVSQVADELPIDVSVVSRHLTQLRHAGILEAERRGKEVRYTVRYDAIVQLLRQLADAIEQCCPPDSESAASCCNTTSTDQEKETRK